MSAKLLIACLASVAAVLAADAAPFAAFDQQPVRDADRTVLVGTAAIGGRLTLDGAAAEPIRRATVVVSGSPLMAPRATLTDDQGRFMVEGLPPGRFVVSASKRGYLSTFYGSRRVGKGPGVPIVVGEGQRVTDVALTTARGAVITGTVTDEIGRPWAGIPVSLLEAKAVGGERVLLPSGLVRTDDRGVYRLFGLAPGAYLVSAAGTDRGYEGAVRQTPGEKPPQFSPQAKPVGFAPILYPGTTDVAAAETITVRASEERGGVDFTLRLTPTATVKGVVATVDGAPVENLQVSLVTDVHRFGFRQQTEQARGVVNATTVATQNGTFLRDALPPGRYAFYARARRTRTPGSGGDTTLWASADVSLAPSDNQEITLTLQPGLSVSGRAVFEGTGPAPQAIAATEILLRPMSSSELSFGVEPVRLRPDGTFEFPSVAPGRYRIDVRQQGAGRWTLRSAIAASLDVADAGLTVAPSRNVADLVVTLTDQPATLAGLVVDSLERPAPDYKIIICSTEPAHWVAQSRRTRLIQPSTDGRYEATALPAGEYFVAAVADLDAEELNDPGFLQAVAASATRVAIGWNERKTLNLKLGVRFDVRAPRWP